MILVTELLKYSLGRWRGFRSYKRSIWDQGWFFELQFRRNSLSCCLTHYVLKAGSDVSLPLLPFLFFLEKCAKHSLVSLGSPLALTTWSSSGALMESQGVPTQFRISLVSSLFWLPRRSQLPALVSSGLEVWIGQRRWKAQHYRDKIKIKKW